jgi:hypothetical protein
MSHSRRFVPLLQKRLLDPCDYSLRPANFLRHRRLAPLHRAAPPNERKRSHVVSPAEQQSKINNDAASQGRPRRDRGQRKVCYVLYARDRLKLGGLDRACGWRRRDWLAGTPCGGIIDNCGENCPET